MTKPIKRFESKVVLVTGGRSGIGQAMARRLRDEGNFMITAQRGKDAEFDWIKTDFSHPDAPGEIVQEVIAQKGQLDVLINNAGMMQE